jgi:endonuclease YncB( thermonuclease family)
MWRIALAAVALASPAAAQTVTDGDTIKQGGVTYRLWGIDAPESKQACADGWPAGSLASTRLRALISSRTVVCDDRGRDRYGRTIARCTAAGADLGAIMVREGMAWAFVKYSRDYVDQEARARTDHLGVHAHGCMPAWEWRARERADKRADRQPDLHR